jgi:SAM-dependent methyltransferase
VKTYDPIFFEDLRKIQARHFWFVARNRVIGAVASTLLPESASRILEVGCGSGSVLPTLAGLPSAGLVVGLDLYREALAAGAARHVLVQADATALPFGAEFHLAGCFDVLEHMDDDIAVAAGICRAIRRGGWLLVTVPAGPGLWSAFDEAAMHRRRYTEPGLRAMLQTAGFEVVFASPFMSTSYPLLWAQRRIGRTSEGRQAVREGIRIVPGLNGLLDWSLRWEPGWLAARRHLPFGSSLLAVARLRE